MSATDRQNRLLVAEDWKRIYQSYRNADFQSYDFDNLRRVMITYIRENYPEDFNDYIESSEYLALIDIMAFLGQSIAFRTDLNARENFLELADRRESVLRLARLLSYNPKRNICASGLLKFTAVQTTQTIYDSNGRNLTGQTVQWNDPSNQNWHDQFIKILNSALSPDSQFGNPDDKAVLYGIPTEQYRLQAVQSGVPVYSFGRNVDGRNMSFEVVSTTFKNSPDIYEEPPMEDNRLAFLYRDDGKGNSSSNTGFFVHFKQGTMGSGTFNVSQPSTSESVDIDAKNVNNTDIWLHRLDQDGKESELWVEVPALEGNNIIYNSLSKNIKNIFSVTTRANDKISLQFSDGTFGNIPRGSFRVYYRISNGLSYTINPKDIRNVSITIPYISNNGMSEALTITLSLTSSVSNASAAESTTSIKANAPANYYTQNRMVTGEDYSISPLVVNQDVMKIKSVNRSSSGISRYFDLIDPTGKYSKTNIFSDDGALYKEEFTDSIRFSYLNKTDIESIIYNKINGLLSSIAMRDFYYETYTFRNTDQYTWQTSTIDTNLVTGNIRDTNDDNLSVGSFGSSGLLKYVTTGALLRFTLDGISKWTNSIRVYGSGITDGSIYISDVIPDGALLDRVIPAWSTSLNTNTVASMVDLIYGNKPFGLRYDIDSRTWKIVYDVNLNAYGSFDITNRGDITRQHKDASWMLLFTTDTEFYTVKQRLMRYIFESDNQVRFLFDSSDKIYDIKNNVTVKDKIKILSVNDQLVGQPSIDREWEITNQHVGLDGYVDTKKIQLTFADTDEDGIVDNPDIFNDFVTVPVVNSPTDYDGYVILESYETDGGIYDYKLSSTTTMKFYTTDPVISSTDLGTYYYITGTNTVKKCVYDTSLAIYKLIVSNDYKVYKGRHNIKFQYIHNADHNARIDPGLTNLMDIYVLTKQYDKEFRQWVNGTLTTKPLPPSSDVLHSMMSPGLNRIKSINDEIIYHPVKFKVLFGAKASNDVRATFKIVKNTEVVISDNDIKSQVLTAINTFFNLENWDFGDKFYFSELQTYVMNAVSPYIVNFIIVPTMSSLTFGSLFEINAEKDEIFVNGATISDIEIITAVTANKIKSAGAIAIENKLLQNITTTSQGII